jgi:arylsulfatase
VPTCIRWPDVIKPGAVVSDFFAHEDFIPTFAAAAGDTDLVQKLLKGATLNGKQFKVHLDGYNLLPYFKGEVKESPRKEFVYWSDDGDLMAIRLNQYKIAFMQQQTEPGPRYPGGVWMGQFDKLRSPVLYNLRADPFERGPDSLYYGDYFAHRMFLFVPAQAAVAQWMESFKEFPPRAKAASFTVSDAMDKIMQAKSSQN